MAAKPPYARDGFEQTIKTMEVKKLFIKNVRCFEGKKEFNIRPLTFLVGENSTGKSTALGCMQALHYGIQTSGINLTRHKKTFEGFNIPPYNMGAFSDIFRKQAATKKFVLGFELHGNEPDFDLTFTHSFTFCEKEGFGIAIAEKEWEFKDGKIIIANNGDASGIHIAAGSDKKQFSINAEESWFARHSHSLDALMDELRRASADSSLQEKLRNFLGNKLPATEDPRFYRRHEDLLSLPHLYSIAPVRAAPLRNYDSITRNEDPQGSDVPADLVRIRKFREGEWKRLYMWLVNFGKASELFEDIKIESTTNDAFQLLFKVRGKWANFADIGYGVSQILPILVRLFTDDFKSMFLVQQAEESLHPRAQAAFLSLLTNEISGSRTIGNCYVLETHSDYMLDRARIEIMKGKISPENVSLIYLEPAGDKVAVHNITFDKEGNFINAPGSYREFFNKEAHKLLGF